MILFLSLCTHTKQHLYFEVFSFLTLKHRLILSIIVAAFEFCTKLATYCWTAGNKNINNLYLLLLKTPSIVKNEKLLCLTTVSYCFLKPQLRNFSKHFLKIWFHFSSSFLCCQKINTLLQNIKHRKQMLKTKMCSPIQRIAG